MTKSELIYKSLLSLKSILLIYFFICNLNLVHGQLKGTQYFMKDRNIEVSGFYNGGIVISLFNDPSIYFGNNKVGISIKNSTTDILKVSIEFSATSISQRKQTWIAGEYRRENGIVDGSKINPGETLKGEENYCQYDFFLDNKNSPFKDNLMINPVLEMGYRIIKIENISEIERKEAKEKEEKAKEEREKKNKEYAASLEKTRQDQAKISADLVGKANEKKIADEKLVQSSQDNNNNSRYSQSNKYQNTSTQNGAITNTDVTRSNNYITEGNELQRQGNYAAAKEKYNRAYEINPYSSTAKINIDIANQNMASKQSVNNHNNELLQQAAQSVANTDIKAAQLGVGIAAGAKIIEGIMAGRAERKERERQEAERARIEEEIRLEKIATHQRLVENRKKTIARYPDGKMPLSSLSSKANEVYYFIYSCNEATLESDSPVMYISNAFTIEKYADDTWPFKDKVMEQIAKSNKGLSFKLSGFYMTKSDVEAQLQLLVNDAYKYSFTVKDVFYMSKNSSEKNNSDTNFWGNESTKKIIETNDTLKTNKPNIQVDFWGNPIKN